MLGFGRLTPADHSRTEEETVRGAARLGLAACAGAALASACVAAALAAGGPGRGTTIASGRSAGKAWRVEASSVDVQRRQARACFSVVAGRSPIARTCASYVTELPAGAPPSISFGLGLSWVRGCPGFAYGLVAGGARAVTMKLSSGRTIRTPALRSPAGLPRTVRWVVAALPCDVTPLSAVARDAAGRIVGRGSLSSGG
jgi:hypothetical protein